LDEPLAARLLSVGFYFGAIAGGALWVASRRAADRAAALLPLLVALAHSTLTTARAVLLFALSMWAASAFASLVVARRPIARIRPLTLLGGAMAAAALVAVSTGMQLARGGADDLTTPQEAFSHLGTWLFGHLPGFGAWLRDGFDPGAPLQMGRRTFGGAFHLLGLAERERGVFADFARLSSGRETNIYTALRGLIEDFGLAGSLLSAAIAGWASGVTYAQALRGRPGRQVALALAYCFILWTPIVSFFSYNTLLVAFALAVPALHPWAQEGGPHADAADLRPLPL
ncbi:MAG TPA: O-antigen polymerase, partial [Myxococcales bacterium]